MFEQRCPWIAVTPHGSAAQCCGRAGRM